MGELREDICQKFGLDVEGVDLSMGMSADYIRAVIETRMNQILKLRLIVLVRKMLLPKPS